jgi:L-threonylcarbamoyladenylate synthase
MSVRASIAEILRPTDEAVAKAADAIRSGEIVGMPTETVYGLAGDVFQTSALGRIYEAKERPTFDPLIAHVAPPDGGTATLDWLSDVGLIEAGRIPEPARAEAERLMRSFWPGPMTLVLPKRAEVPDLATSGLPTVAVRMPSHPVAQALIRASGTALAAPSANRFGRISPTTAEAVREELGDRIHWILDGGACSVGVESTILALDSTSRGGWKLLRPGGTPVEAIEKVLGGAIARPSTAPGAGSAPLEAPGLLESHYAPAKPLELLPKPLPDLTDAELKAWLSGRTVPKELGLLLMGGDAAASARRLERASGARVEARSLSAQGDLTEAATALFSTLRGLDRSRAALLIAEPCPSERGLGHAIADRLRRASSKEGK